MAEEISPSHFFEAKLRTRNALKNYAKNNVLFERFPCALFEGCQFKFLNDEEFERLFDSLRNRLLVFDNKSTRIPHHWKIWIDILRKGNKGNAQRARCFLHSSSKRFLFTVSCRESEMVRSLLPSLLSFVYSLLNCRYCGEINDIFWN